MLGYFFIFQKVLKMFCKYVKNVLVYNQGGANMTVKELATKCSRSEMTIYRWAKKLGRLPTEEEVLSAKKGRPQKYN